MQKLKKSQLKRLFTQNDGTEVKNVIIVPCKMNPESPFAPQIGAPITRTGNELFVEGMFEDTPLDKYLDHFTAMNCNNESGYYPAFYIKN